MFRSPLLILALLIFSDCKEPIVTPDTKTVVFNLIVPEAKPIHALSFKISFDPQIFELATVTGSNELFGGGHLEVAKNESGLCFVILGQKGVHAPISGTGEIAKITLKRLVEPSMQISIIEGVGAGIFYEGNELGGRKTYSFRYKLTERLNNMNDATVTLEIE